MHVAKLALMTPCETPVVQTPHLLLYRLIYSWIPELFSTHRLSKGHIKMNGFSVSQEEIWRERVIWGTKMMVKCLYACFWIHQSWFLSGATLYGSLVSHSCEVPSDERKWIKALMKKKKLGSYALTPTSPSEWSNIKESSSIFTSTQHLHFKSNVTLITIIL